MIYLLVFMAAFIISVVLVTMSSLSPTAKGGLVTTLVAFAAIAYFGGAIWYSPFAIDHTAAFGALEDAGSLVAAIVGVIAGIAGSVYFKSEEGSRLTVRSFLKPLCCAPLTIIPILKLIEGTETVSVLGIATLVVTSYQAGFFWERLLRDTK